ncbi:MAG: hypothetical protein AAGE94_05770 [Acidobacteriota bacterium]
MAPSHPDAVAAALAVLTDGALLTFGPEGWWPPPCRSALDREPLLDLGARVDPAAADALISIDGRSRRVGDLVADASALITGLPTELTWPNRGARRPILTTGAALPPDRLLTVGVASLWLDAVWALEPQADAFASAVTWTRPTLVFASDAELDALGERWDRSCRRWSRLRAVVRWRSADDDRSSDHAERLGAPIVDWPTSRQGAA